MPTHPIINWGTSCIVYVAGWLYALVSIKTFAEVQGNRILIMQLQNFIKLEINNDSEINILNSFRQSLIQAQEYIGNLQHSDGGEFHTDYMGFANAIVLAYYNADEDDVSFDLFIEMGNRLTDCLTFKDEEDLWHSTRQLEERLKHIINLYYFE